MIIGIDTSAIGNKTTGTSVYINCLLGALRNTQHIIKTFSPEDGSSVNNNSLLNSLPFVRRGGVRRHLFRQFQLTELMNKGNVDCGIFPNYLMPLKFNKPSAIVIHDLSFISHPHFYSKSFVLYYKNQIRKTLNKKPVVVTISDYSKKCIHKYLGVDENDIYILQGYIDVNYDTANINIVPLNKINPYLLYVGHIEPRKNLTFLIENFLEWNRLRALNYKLKLAGEVWSGSAEIKTLIKKYSMHPDIEFLGYVSVENLHKLYLNASAFIHTSFVEGFGFPVLEAMKYGLPVLCSEGSGTEEISQGYSVTVNLNNGKNLIEGLDKLNTQINSNRKKYCARYSKKLMDEQLTKILCALERK